MKKFTDIIKEEQSTQDYKWTATVQVSGIVKASSEGAAGELIDKELDEINGMVTYQIENIVADTNIENNE